MKLESFSGTAGLRFDSDLKSFDKLISFYLNAPQRVAATGKKVIAKGPLSPVDFIYAANAVAYDIATNESMVQSVFNGRTDLRPEAAAAGMSPDFSPWSLAMLGATLTGKALLPVDAYSTASSNLDDQITKSFQVMAQAGSSPLHFWEIPFYNPEAETFALTYLKKELQQLFDWLALYTGNKVTEGDLRRSIHLGNLLRQDMAEINTYLAMPKVPIAALEYYLVQMMMGDYAQDPEGLHTHYRNLIDELRIRAGKEETAPGISSSPVRVYLMGDESQELCIFNSIENYGGVMVGCDFRLPLYYDVIDEAKSPLDSLAQWIWRMPCNMPSAKRVRSELDLISKQRPDAVMISSVVGSRYISGAERMFRDVIKEELGVPVLSIETTFPNENAEKVDYQIQAFLETIG